MTYWIHYINKDGKVDKTLLSLFDEHSFKEYIEKTIECVLFIEDVPETNENIVQLNLMIHKFEQSARNKEEKNNKK